MITSTLSSIIISTLFTLNTGLLPQPQTELVSHQISLKERTPGGGYMSDIMANNILLTLAYLNNEPIDAESVDWNSVRRDRFIEFTLQPGEGFAFHQDILDKYEGKVVKTTNSRFAGDQGFKHDGYLMGDGVCHLASLIYWVSKDAGLDALAPTNHNFMPIPGIAHEHGVSIYFHPSSKEANAEQNLYVINTKENPITFQFEVKDNTLKASVTQ